ncbi:MAG: efflux RND transporter permease subunit [Planctomycetota bacterium]|nr:efflux RND transporter permease subunit [Planctomycetota bacterium]
MVERPAAPESRVPSGKEAGHSLWIRATIYRPITVLVLFLALLVVGIISFPRIHTEMLPGGLTTGQCGVFIPIRDGTPREVMVQVAKPTEDLLRTLPGLRSVVSSSGASRCFIRLEFDPKYDISVMVAEVQDRVERARAFWPDTADRYFIWRHRDSDMPAYIASLGVEIDEEKIDLDYIFEEVIGKRLERLSGVARVQIWGLTEKRVEIQLDRNRVEAHAIDVRRLIERLSSDNTVTTAGRVRDAEREYLVRVDGRFQDFQEVLAYPANPVFRIGDFADVDYARAWRDRVSRVDGELSRVVVVFKESSANAVEVCERVAREIDELESTLRRRIPGVGSVQWHAWLDQGELIQGSVNALASSALYGGLCAVLILFLFFRRLAMTALVTLAIPFSLLITVIWLYFSGESFNILSLMGLSLAIGMLVDNSIVVVENILRHGERGLERRAAAIQGVREVGLAVSLATLTTVTVLLPIFFLSDPRFRKITAAIGAPLCVSVLASLLVALVFIPPGAILLTRRRRKDAAGGTSHPESFSRINLVTSDTLAWCLRHRITALVVAGALLASMQLAFTWLPKADLNLDGPRGVQMSLELPPNTSLREANETFARVEDAVREAGERKDLGIKSITSWFDSRGGEVNVFFEPGRRMEEKEFFLIMKPELPKLPGVKFHLGFESFSRDMGRQRLRVFIQAQDYDRLVEAEEIVRRALEDSERFPQLGDVARWSEDERDEVTIEVDRRAAQQLGVDTATVSRMVSWALRGAPLPDFVVDDREYPFWVCYNDVIKESVHELKSILIHRPGQKPVRLDEVATYALRPASGDLHRRNGKLTAGLSASIEGETPPEFRQLVEARLRQLKLPRGCEISMRPDWGGFEEDMKNAKLGLFMALSLGFLIMGLLFESWLLPLSVLFCVPFAFFGSVWLLVVSRVPLDAVGMIGFLMLVGIVVNNAIVLVDYINRLRKRGLERRHAILSATRIRFRPIWMTALTTIFGLLPLALMESRGEGVEYRALAVVLIGGLTTSTFFTLFIVPILYTVLDDVGRLARALLLGRSRA